MRIKKNQDGNNYLLTEENMWVRDFTREDAPFVDINKNIRKEDHFTFLENEFKNNLLRLPWVDSENISMKKVLIVSDGYGFEEKHQIVSRLPKDVVVIGVNGSLAKWGLTNRSMNWYLNNNPYEEGLYYLPRRNRVLPKCILSPRTNNRFVSAYKGSKYKYFPVNESSYSSVGANEVSWQIDDYRNPICAALGIAYRTGAEKICLLCCDDSFETYRDGSERIANGLYQYPQQNIAHNIIDGIFYWLKNHEYFDFDIADCSSGKEYKFATYIKEEEILPFFNKAGEK